MLCSALLLAIGRRRRTAGSVTFVWYPRVKRLQPIVLLFAHDGADAVKTAERLRPDVILMEIGLPIVNGYEACRRMRAQAWDAAFVMVAITGWGRKTVVSSRARPILTCTW